MSVFYSQLVFQVVFAQLSICLGKAIFFKLCFFTFDRVIPKVTVIKNFYSTIFITKSSLKHKSRPEHLRLSTTARRALPLCFVVVFDVFNLGRAKIFNDDISLSFYYFLFLLFI
jgi:hypothetical protein